MNNFNQECKEIWNLEHLQHGFEQLDFDTELEADTLWIAKGRAILATIDWRDGLVLADNLPNGMHKGQIQHLYLRYLQGRFGREYGRLHGLSA